MTEPLHTKNSSEQAKPAVAPHEVLQEVNLEDEFAFELSLLKNARYQPRPNAVDQLLQLIHGQSMVEH